MKHVVCDVIFLKDVKVLSEVTMDLLKACSLDKESKEEKSLLSEDGVSFSKIGVLVLVVKEALNIDDNVNTVTRDENRKVLSISLDELG